MTTTTFHGEDIPPPPMSTERSAAALRSLMRDWEGDGAVDADESETELLVLLSGMVSMSDPTLSEA